MPLPPSASDITALARSVRMVSYGDKLDKDTIGKIKRYASNWTSYIRSNHIGIIKPITPPVTSLAPGRLQPTFVPSVASLTTVVPGLAGEYTIYTSDATGISYTTNITAPVYTRLTSVTNIRSIQAVSSTPPSLYVLTDNNLKIFNQSTGVEISSFLLPDTITTAKTITVDSSNNVYILNEDSAKLLIKLNTTTGVFSSPFSGLNLNEIQGPISSIAANGDGNKIYYSSVNGAISYFFSSGPFRSVTTGPHGQLLTHYNNNLYGLNPATKLISQFNSDDDTVRNLTSTLSNPGKITVNQGGIYITDLVNNTVEVFT